MHWLRVILVGALSLALSGISILCCYVFGTHLAPGQEGQLYGVLGGVADALKAFLPLAIAGALAASQKARATAGAAMFIVFSVYSFTSELGLYALSRSAITSDVQASKEGYEAAKAERARIASRLKELGPQRPPGTVKADIAAAKQNRHWEQSGQCAAPSVSAERTFCATFEKLQGELASAEEADRLRAQDQSFVAKLDGINLAAVMRSSDPQSEALSRFTGFSAQSIRDGLAILVAALIELGSGLGLWVATAGIRGAQPAPAQEAPRVAEPVVKEPQKAVEAAAPMVEALSYDERPKAFPAASRPRLIASQANPVGSVPVILAEILEPGRGKVEIADLFAAYADACEAHGKRPIPANEFPAEIAALCEKLGIKIEGSNSGVFLLRVKIRPVRRLKAEGDKA
jgi:hypothetical protein